MRSNIDMSNYLFLNDFKLSKNEYKKLKALFDTVQHVIISAKNLATKKQLMILVLLSFVGQILLHFLMVLKKQVILSI